MKDADNGGNPTGASGDHGPAVMTKPKRATRKSNGNGRPRQLPTFEELRAVTQRLQSEMDGHLQAADEIAKGLQSHEEEIRKIIESRGGVDEEIVGRKRNGQRAVRTGTNTEKILAIVRKHGKTVKGHKQMDSGECARIAKEEFGIQWPHSSYQSLKGRGAIDLRDGNVVLLIK